MIDLLERISAALSAGRFDLSEETQCQAQIETWLRERMPDVEISREHRLSPRDRPDFFICGVAVEVKMNKCRPSDVLRQLTRYAEHEAVEALVLVANRAAHLPRTLNGKPLVLVSLGQGWL